MKKIISLMIGVLSISMVSCNNTKVLEENTKEIKSNDKYTIAERNIANINEDMLFMPLFYDSEGIFGTLNNFNSHNFDDYNIPYYLDYDGTFKEVDKGTFTDEEIGFIKDKGSNGSNGVYFMEGIRASERKFYYIDLKNNIKINLEGYEKIYNKIEPQFNIESNGGYTLEGNENYYIHLYQNCNNEGQLEGLQEILIVDLKNNIFYTMESTDTKYYYFYYDQKERSIMAIDNLGKIYKVRLEEGKVICEFYKDINLNDLRLYNKHGYFSCYMENDNLILNIDNDTMEKDYSDRSNILYNLTLSEITIMNPEKILLGKIEDTDFFLISYNDDKYLAELNDIGEMDLIYKLDDSEGYKYMSHIANEDGSSIFIVRIKYNEENVDKSDTQIIKENIKYSIIDINKNKN
ncbi:hypothetical protein [Clostridium sp. 1001275B_160808_H3]|uniref:hypothetical protein n=1 Tax=Clostridium sp. 1001275B_160808_H3 TaxID=2787110 RepID=UPI001898FEFB|nr:hypothetical protein [Clostridium sp. 1001275B_160808_H3]